MCDHEDFASEPTIVEKGRGQQVFFIPKFHCELNPIERVRAQVKIYYRGYTNFTLKQIVNPAFDAKVREEGEG